jgi:hypothetical protein
MAKKPARATMAGLLDSRLANKPAPAVATSAGEPYRAPSKARPGEPPIKARPNAKDRDFRTLMARINFEGWSEIRRACAAMDVTAEDTIILCLNNWLAANGFRPAILKTRRPGTVKGGG